MPPVGFESTISAGERPQTYALNRSAAGTGRRTVTTLQKKIVMFYNIVQRRSVFKAPGIFKWIISDDRINCSSYLH